MKAAYEGAARQDARPAASTMRLRAGPPAAALYPGGRGGGQAGAGSEAADGVSVGAWWMGVRPAAGGAVRGGGGGEEGRAAETPGRERGGRG